MNYFMRLFFFACTVGLLVVALWLSITFFGVLLLVGGVAVLVMAARNFLIKKGIVAAPSGDIMPHTAEEGTIIEAEYKVITSQTPD